MSININKSLNQLQTAVGSLFINSVTDLIRGIRSHKEDEAQYINQAIQEIKQNEISSQDKDIKVQAIEKLTYLQMLGYPMDWASFRVIECISHGNWTHKRAGYLAACQSFSENTDVMLLVTNLIRKDCLSPALYESSIALTCLATICTTELARDLVPDIVSMLSSARPYIRKKAVLVMYKIFLKFPEALRPSFGRLKEKLDDQDPSVVSAAVNVICELARKNAKNYLPLAPTLYQLLTKSTNNWMLIKIVKLFAVLLPLEERLGKKLIDPLTQIINETNAMSLLYECIQTCIVGLSQHKAVMRLCVTKLRMFIEHPDQNLKYLGLLALSSIMKVFPKGISEHRDIILNCLEDEDETIRRRAIELITGMVDKKNLAFIVDKLKQYIETATGVYRDELLEKIISICSQDKYKFVTDFEWYLNILYDLTQIKGITNGILIRDQLLDVCVRAQAIREDAVQLMTELLEDPNIMNEGNISEGGVCEALYAAAWIIGEYPGLNTEPLRVVKTLCKSDVHNLPEHIQSVYIQTLIKLIAFCASSDNETISSSFNDVIDITTAALPSFLSSLQIEVQERACFLEQLLQMFKEPEENRTMLIAELKLLFGEVLNPVSSQAILRVKIPEGLDLDAWIGPEMEEPSSDYSNYDNKYNTEETNPSRYAGGSYGGFGDVGGDRGNKWEPREGQSEFKVPDLEAVQRYKRENRAKRAGVGGKEQLFYLDEDDDDVAEKQTENFGPVKNLEDDVQLTTQERRAFNANTRGGRRPIRNQKPKVAVKIIEDDENPEGWEEQAKVPEVKQEKDKLSMVVIDASASSESLPQRTHHVVDNSASTNATNSKPTSQPASRGGATAGRGAPVRRGTGAPRGGGARGRGQRPGAPRGGATAASGQPRPRPTTATSSTAKKPAETTTAPTTTENGKMDKDQFYKLLRGGVMPHITIKKVLVKISEAIERISQKLNMVVIDSTDGKASLYCSRDGFHVGVLIKAENENQLAVAIRSDNAELSKSFAEEVDALFKQ